MAKSEDFEKASKVLDNINLAVNKYKAGKHGEALIALSLVDNDLDYQKNNMESDVFCKLKSLIDSTKLSAQKEFESTWV